MTTKRDRKRSKDEALLRDVVLDEWAMTASYVPDCHRWVDAEIPPKEGKDGYKSRFIVADFEWGPSLKIEGRGFSVESYPDLYRKFAGIAPTEESFQDFANEFGLLGIREDQEQLSGIGLKSPFTIGESWWFWFSTHRTIRAAADLLDRISAGDVSEVLTNPWGRWLWHEPGKPPTKNHKQDPDNPLFLRGLRNYRHEKLNDPIQVARHFIEQTINERLDRGRSTVRLDWDVAREEFIFHVRPVGLASMMFWQIARVASGKVEYRSCPICRKVLEVSKGRFTKAKTYCDTACKMRAQRLRVKIHGLLSEGKRMQKIAKVVGIDVETAKMLIAPKRGRK